MQFNSFLRIFLIIILLTSCTNENPNLKLPKVQKDVVEADTLASKIIDDLNVAKNQKNAKEFKENLKIIEKKYGEQWGFCECVVANDSVNIAIIATTIFEGPKFDKLMDRSNYISEKCQAFLSLDANKTPNERASHERKVKKCLQQAKK